MEKKTKKKSKKLQENRKKWCLSPFLQHCLFRVLLCPAWRSAQVKHSSSPWVFTQKHLQTTHTKSWLVFCFLQDSPRVSWPDSRSAQPLCVRQPRERQTPAALGDGHRRSHPSVSPVPKAHEVTEVSLGEIMVNSNSCFTGTWPHPHSKEKAKFVDVGLQTRFFLTSSSGDTDFSSWLLYFHSCWANSSWNEETLDDSTLLKVSIRETLTLAISVIILPLNNLRASTSLIALKITTPPH